MSADAPPDRARSAELGDAPARRRLASIERLAQVGFWEWTIGTGELIWSDELYRVFGHEPGDVRPSYEAWLAAIHPDDRPEVQALVERAVRTHESYAVDHRIIRPDGAVRLVHGRGDVEVGPDGEAVRLSGIASDVTESRRASEHLHEFVSEVAHELRTPLASIQSSVDLLRLTRQDLPPEARDATMTVLGRQVSRLRSVANALLEIDALRPISGGISLVPVRVEHAVAQAISAVPRPDLVLLSVDVPSQLEVKADTELLGRALGALLSNAYQHGGDAIDVRATATDFDVTITVEDDGPGVDPAVRDTMFAPFVRSHAATAPGSGLGLTLAHRLALVMGGRLTYTSRIGGGARFSLVLERTDDAEGDRL